MEEKINILLNTSLRKGNLPFTYDTAELVKSTYYDDANYEIQIMFKNFNGTKTNHKNVLNCYDGRLTQIMFQDSGFPGASINFDRQLIPDAAIPSIVKVAYFEDKYQSLKEEIKKANI